MKPLNPVQKFALYGGLCIAGLSLALGFTGVLFLEQRLKESEWDTTVKMIEDKVAQHRLAAYFTGPPDNQQSARLHPALEHLLHLPEVVRIKLWDREARVLWSDDPQLLGKQFPENRNTQQALAGRVAVELKVPPRADEEYAREKSSQLAEIYVPVRATPSGEILGVVEVNKDPRRLLADIRRMQAVLWSIGITGGIVLYIVLVPIVRRSYRRQQHLEAKLRERAEETEAKYRTLVERIPAITYIAGLDEASSTLYVSPQVEPILGFSPAEWLADPQGWEKQLHPEDRERVLTELAGSHASGEPFRAEYRMRSCDGRVVWFRDEGVVVRDDAGKPLFLHGVMSDITDRKRSEEALAQRTRQLEAIRKVSEEITRELDLTTLLQLIIRRASELVGVVSGSVQLWDEGAQALIPQAWVGPGEWRAGMRLHSGQGVAGTVAQRREGMIVNDYRASPYAHPMVLERTAVTAVVCEPLLYRDRLVGVIALDQEGPGARFSAEDREILALFAAQAAIAIENARLYAATEQRATELATLREIGQNITSRLELPTVLEAVVAGTMELLDNPFAQIILWDEASQTLRFGAALGPEAERVRGEAFALGRGINGTVAQTREAMVLDDYQASPYAVPECADVVATITVPILFEDRLLGVLHSHTTIPGKRFTPDDLRRLQMLATQAAIAIENARLHEAARRELTERTQVQETLQALYRASLQVQEPLELRDRLTRLLEAARDVLELDRFIVLLPDAGGRRLQAVASQGTEEALEAIGVPIGPEGGGLAQAYLTHRTIVWDGQASVPEDLRLQPPYDQIEAFRSRVFAIVPLVVRGRTIGILGVDRKHSRRPLDPVTVELLHLFATQAAIAIENARLYEQIRRHAAELDDRVKARTAELEEALRVKAQFLANMSHELRTPLNFILGFSQLLQQGTAGALTAKQANYLGHIHAGGKRLFELVTDMLDLSQVETGEKGLKLDPVLLGPMVEELLDMVRVQAAQKGLRVSTALDPRLQFVVADRAKLTQIIANLIGNAVKFTPDGGAITVRAYQKAESTKQKAEGGEQRPEGSGQKAQGSETIEPPRLPSAGCLLPSVVIEVEDTGIGIKPEDLERIFKSFEQVDSSDTRKYGGAGLGLALVRTLVELHGGRVWAESAGSGQGARFVVRLPHLEVLRRKRVMLVADEAPILESLGTVLGGAGYAVEPAQSGAQALAALDANPPDLLVLDIGLPGGDGWEILRQVRESEATRALPVLVLTGPDQIHADKALALGANEFLAKPVSARILVETVNGLLVWRDGR